MFCLKYNSLIQISNVQLNSGNHSSIASTEWKFFVNQDCVVRHAVFGRFSVHRPCQKFENQVLSFANGGSEVSLMNDVVSEVIEIQKWLKLFFKVDIGYGTWIIKLVSLSFEIKIKESKPLSINEKDDHFFTQNVSPVLTANSSALHIHLIWTILCFLLVAMIAFSVGDEPLVTKHDSTQIDFLFCSCS